MKDLIVFGLAATSGCSIGLLVALVYSGSGDNIEP